MTNTPIWTCLLITVIPVFMITEWAFAIYGVYNLIQKYNGNIRFVFPVMLIFGLGSILNIFALWILVWFGGEK